VLGYDQVFSFDEQVLEDRDLAGGDRELAHQFQLARAEPAAAHGIEAGPLLVPEIDRRPACVQRLLQQYGKPLKYFVFHRHTGEALDALLICSEFSGHTVQFITIAG